MEQRNRTKPADADPNPLQSTADRERLLRARIDHLERALTAEREHRRETDALLEAVSASCLEGLAVADPRRDASGAVMGFAWRRVDGHAAALTGRPVHGYAGRGVDEWPLPGPAAGLPEVLQRALAADGPIRTIVDHRGDRHLHLVAVHHGKGVLLTWQRANEQTTAALHDLGGTLDERVAERTGQLEAANAALKQRNEALDEFAYAASHDLREPLRKVKAFAELLESEHATQLSPPARDYLARMIRATARMSRLVDDLLAYARLTTQPHCAEPVDLGEALEVVRSDLGVRLQETAGRIDAGPLPTIDADPTQVRQLLQNLVGNGLKFHRPGVPPVVRVWAEPVEDAPSVRLFVEDNGIGFDEAYLDRVFAPFQRLHSRAAYEGSGIGLSICQRVVERHGGTITAESTPGQGSRFIVTLPARGNALEEG